MGLGKKDFKKIMICAAETGISDIHITAGKPVFWRRGGTLSPLREFVPSGDDIFNIFHLLVQEEYVDQFVRNNSLNIGWSYEKWRYRVHVYKKMSSIAFAIRVQPGTIPQMEALGQASMIQSYLSQRSGLLLVTGATGAGKTTTVASFLEELNQKNELHILTLEDPIEYIFPEGKSLISQLEMGRDFDSYSQAVENAMRESPDVIMVSEMRDSATVKAVLNAATSGHLVIATMHAGGVIEAIQRLISMYPAHQQDMARLMLSAVLLGVCNQKLVANRHRQCHCAMEMLKVNKAARNLIRQEKYEQLASIMEGGKQEGMQTMVMAEEKIKKSFYPAC